MKYMKWEDLEIGDKVKLSEGVIKNRFKEHWFKFWQGILEITNIVYFEKITDITIKASDKTPMSVYINKITGSNAYDNFPFFEIVEVKK